MLRRSALRFSLVAFATLGVSALAATPSLVSVRLQPGAHQLVLTAELPEGYAFNAEAPQHAASHATGLTAATPELAFTDRSARISIPLTVPAAGGGLLTVDLTLYYCAETQGSVCQMDRRTLTYAVSNAKDGQAGTVEIALPMRMP